MRISFTLRRAMAAASLLAFVGACSETTPTGVANDLTVRQNVALTAADVIVQGTDLGQFANTINPTNAGPAFWDVASNDDLAGNFNCNVGWYAAGTLMSSGCNNQALGSYANRGGFTRYWGDGGTFNNSSSFMFNGALGYLVELRGSYVGNPAQEVGWFTMSGSTYNFNPIAMTVGTTVFVPAGANWGFYVKTRGHLPGPSCAVDYDCSDATGDLHQLPGTNLPPQQFALFTNADASQYLVGIEDMDELTAIIGQDDDFQDYIFRVTPIGINGMFVIGDKQDHGLNTNVMFWGAQWWKNNSMSGIVGNGVASFKGFASDFSLQCGGSWSASPGNSAPPPSALTPFVAVIVTSTAVKGGPVISGNIREILIVKTDPGYAGNPGHAGTGVVTNVVCPSFVP